MTHRPASAPAPGAASRGGARDASAAVDDDSLMCPICRDTFTEPVVLLQSGRAYDASCLRMWFLVGGTKCPLTGVPLASHATAPDAALAARAAAARAAADEDEWWVPAVAAVTLKAGVDGGKGGGGGRPARRPWTACLARGATRGSEERE